MAHYAELDNNNVVLRVIVIDNKDTADAYGNEKESIGAAYCERLFGGKWMQTSYNGNIRKNYAGPGFTYYPSIDAFVAPKPFPSWVLNTTTGTWVAPVPMPEETIGIRYVWDEVNTAWIQTV